MILLDSSFSYAVQAKMDKYHQAALNFLESSSDIFGVPDVTLTEIAQILSGTNKHGNRAVSRFIEYALAQPYQLVHVETNDLRRVSELLTTYEDSRLDFVDLYIVALAERLNIREICTFDRRDFAIVRTKHVEALTLLP